MANKNCEENCDSYIEEGIFHNIPQVYAPLLAFYRLAPSHGEHRSGLFLRMS